MGAHILRARQNLPITLTEAWDFVSNPRNLADITPPEMGFEVTTPDLADKMYAGMVITYKVSPLLGIKTTWVTEITQVEEPRYFIDNQRIGPYSIWHHQHFLEEIEGGVQMDDLINYVVPGGPLGDIINELAVQNKLRHIFEFRRKALEQKFGIMPGGFLDIS